jgi:hypothetical protein
MVMIAAMTFALFAVTLALPGFAVLVMSRATDIQ